MSEFNEELLNDVDDYPDLAEADEDALLQDDDDGDVLELVPEEELGESLDVDSRVNISEQDEDDVETHREKFAVERQRITAPEIAVKESNTPKHNNQYPRSNNRGHHRGRGGNSGRGGRGHARGTYTYGNQPGRNKTVLINPRYPGVVQVNNNVRLAWDTSQHEQQYHPNPWTSGAPPGQMGRPMHAIQGPLPGTPMPPMQTGPPMQQPMHGYQASPHMQPNYQGPALQHMHQEPHMQQGPMLPVQNMAPPVQPLQFISPQQPYMPQPLPPGVQQSPMQNPPAIQYWDGQNQYTPIEQNPNQQFMQSNYQPTSWTMNPNHPSQNATPNFPMYNQQGNISPMVQQNFNDTPNFNPHNNRVFNNNQGNMSYSQGNRVQQKRRELFTQKRKVMMPVFPPNKKTFVIKRPGPGQQQQNIERPSVVREVTVTNVTTVKIEEDEETRDLRLKIEEQKKKREAILQWKERRRLEMLKMGSTEDSAPDQKVTALIQNMNQQSPVKLEKKEPQSTPLIKVENQQVKQFRQPIRQEVQPVTFQSPNRPIKLKKQMGNNIVITNGFSRKFTKYQQKRTNTENRVVLAVPTAPLPVPEPELKLDKQHLSNFLADRKILAKDESLMTTRKVVIKNISTSTGDKKIFQISKSIGEVQKLHRDKNERHATITFKSVASAHAFFKKYQRHMLDLSMIEVSLCPMSESDE